MITTISQMNKEYDSIEKQLDKISKVIFTIDSNTNILEHEIMQLSTDIENLGLSLNQLNERMNIEWN